MHRRVFLAIGADGFGQRQGPITYRGVDHPQIERAAQLALEGSGVLLETVQLGQQTQGFLVKQLALAGQAEPATAAVAQHDPQGAFQLAHVGADGRSRQVEVALGIGKALVAHNADKDAQQFQVRQGRGHGATVPQGYLRAV